MSATDRLLHLRKKIDSARVRRNKTIKSLGLKFFKIGEKEKQHYRTRINLLNKELEDLINERNLIKLSRKNNIVLEIEPPKPKPDKEPEIKTPDLPLGANPVCLLLK